MTTTGLIASGQFHVEPDPTALQHRALLIRGSELVTTVEDAAGQEIAVACLRDLKAHLSNVEATRKLLKDPIITAGKRLDQLAKDHVQPLEAHALRLGSLLAAFQEQEKQRVLREERERAERILEAQAQEQARLDEARALAGGISTEADLNRAIQAEAEARAAVEQTNEVIRAPLPEASRQPGMIFRKKLDYEVTDMVALYKARPDLCHLSPNRAEILRVCTVHSVIPGIRFIEEAKVGVRTAHA